MKKIKNLFLLLLVFTLILGASGCKETPVNNTEINFSQGTESIEETTDTSSSVNSEPPQPVYYNPLTGLKADYDVSASRPVAVMVNNIRQALPQEGISHADIVLECLVEGGITRLMCVFSEYKNLEVIGSIRSSRPYYLDFAQAFDAIYCHAGGSDEAYAQIASRRINNIDGVRKDPLDVYFRDPERLKTMAKEHTMMTTGKGIADTIAHYNYRTTLRDDYQSPFSLAQEGSSLPPEALDASHIYLPISYYQTVDYVYNTETREYLRYQYNGQKHIDGKNGTQLSFKNIIILFCNTRTLDSYGLLGVSTTGSGKGYLAKEGKYIPITWSRENRDGNLTLTSTETGEKILLNPGKTAINICPLSIQNKVNMNSLDRIIPAE